MLTKYYKVLNSEEKHHGFQYREGLNELVQDGGNRMFDGYPSHGCAPRGLHFTDIMHIYKFLCLGDHLREITFPEDARILLDGANNYRADKIILGSRVEYTDDLLMKSVTNENDKHRLYNAIYSTLQKPHELLKLTEKYPDLIDPKYTTNVISCASANGHVEMVHWWFTSPDAPPEKKYSGWAIDMASANGHIEMVNWWFTSPDAPPDKKYSEWAIDEASKHGHIKMVNWWFTSPNAPPKKKYSKYAIDDASTNGLIEMVNWWFTSPDAPPEKKCSECAIDGASRNGHIGMVDRRGIREWVQ